MSTEAKDDKLWRIAQKRASFRKNLFSYLVINAFLWGIWWFTSGSKGFNSGTPWPAWVMLGWGLSLAMQYYKAYNGDKDDMAIEEYEKLKKEREA